jgi:hypothetical protein
MRLSPNPKLNRSLTGAPFRGGSLRQDGQLDRLCGICASPCERGATLTG